MNIGIVGSGVWGTSLAIAAAQAGSKVEMWSRSQEVADDINSNHRNTKYIRNVKLSTNISASTNISFVANCEVILLVVPSQNLRSACDIMANSQHNNADPLRIKKPLNSVDGVLNINEEVKGVLDVVYNELQNSNSVNLAKPPSSMPVFGIDKTIPLVICAKGVEKGTLALMSDIVKEYFPHNPVAVLSGPNFADEMAQGLPACATLACENKTVAKKIIQFLGSKLFRIYYSSDVIGAQIGGSVKNVIAIACGISVGMGLGENARAALVTRGMAEIARLCVKMGGKQQTLLGLSGVGDIVLTCGSEKSRNMSLGVAIGKGKRIGELLKAHKTVEGVETSRSVFMLAEKLGIDMPITGAVKAILYDNASVKETVQKLLERPFATEQN